MLKFRGVCVLETGERIEDEVYFIDKIVICFPRICPHPDRAWAGNKEYYDYCRQENETLIALGFVTAEALATLSNSPSHVAIAVEYPDVERAIVAFEKFFEAGLGDFYFYHNGMLYDKCE